MRLAATRSVSERLAEVAFSPIVTATVAVPVASERESCAHDVSSPVTDICQSQLALTSNESVVPNDGARIAWVSSVIDCIGSATSSLHAPAESNSARAAAVRKKLFESLFSIIAYFLRSTSTGRWSETFITLISSYEGTAVRSTSYDGELPV